ncbi:hypothetical protein IAE37_003946 [Pseudomonas sp. S31]|uniref:DUF6708 domain-containing protein n=1 Tax=Pseudomonas sp. S31 TaxID=1564473 RepID=UPI001914BB5E|nr:DUF6708 domain-containing protein [Pseudomonas sp. S31]MBK5001670.1 hypothetical protein [Pseudomonas sp. S31]
MAIFKLFKPTIATHYPPKTTGQLYCINKHVLSLRNPWVADSVFMGKLYLAMTLGVILYTYPHLYDPARNYSQEGAYVFTAMLASTPLVFVPFLIYRVFFIKTLSGFYLNRHTKKIYYKRIKTLIIFDWQKIEGAQFVRREFGGSSYSTSYALAFAPLRADGTLHQKDCLWIDSNEPTDPDIKHVAEVWEYLRHFMDHGPDKLPPPGEPNWWHRPLHAICLTPAEAWRHYAPWRTGEPGEMQGKKNWQLPFWAVLFPYNFSLAVCWYLLCRTFNVRAAPAPAEAFEEAPIKPGIRKRP